MTQPLSGNAPGEEVGRNAPCPCGSGKKYKRCHGKVETPKISPMKIKVEGAEPRSGGAWAEQLKAAGMDPSQVDPNAMMNMQKMLARMPKGQLQRIQALMQKAMSGKDVTREAQELERSLPPDMLAQMQAMSGMMGGLPDMGAPGEEETIEAAEATSEMSPDEARQIVEQAVAEGKLTREAAEQLLAGGGAPAEGEEPAKAVEGISPEAGETKKGFWKKLTRR